MAIQCKYCGTELLKDDSRFCNKCGMLVPSHPFSSQSLSASKGGSPSFPASSSVKQQEEHKPALREQVAHLPSGPPAPPVQRGFEEKKPQGETPLQRKLPETPKPVVQGKVPSAPLPAQPGPFPNLARPLPSLARPRGPVAPERILKAPVPPKSSAPPSPVSPASMEENVVLEKDALAQSAQDASSLPIIRHSTPAPAAIQELQARMHASTESSVPDEATVQELSDVDKSFIEALPTVPMAAVPKKAVEGGPGRPTTVSESVPMQEIAVEDLPTRVISMSEVEEARQEVAVEDLPTRVISMSEVEEARQEVAVEDLPTRATALAEPEELTPEIEDLPTRVMPAVRPGQMDAHNKGAGRSSGVDHASLEIEHQSTMAVPLPEQAAQPVMPTRPAAMQFENTVREGRRSNEYIDHRQNEMASQQPAIPFTPSPYPGNGAFAPPSQQASPMTPVSPPTHRPRRLVPVVIAVVLLLLIVLGAGSWYVSTQSVVSPITQPQTSFQDTHLGVSLLYPNGWVVQNEASKSVVHFYATSNHIGEIDISVASVGSSNVTQALQQEAAKLSFSGIKAGTAQTFAGSTWQQVQGTVLQSGANYAGSVLITQHGSNLITIVQLAPQSNYTDWESTFFAPLRKSLKLL